ncbi:VanW family protein [Acetivibrio straminisolvens]|jgi:vancomycin resistance protein YoaR|uniref:VanW family protein n=1 Tax=Acetivibrio straminisolvens TaxID=253314 RepID=UPI0022401F8F|nr:VanW family protein [Acetivibrio straminisolvens]
MGNKIRLEKIFAILMTAFLLISNVGCKSNERKVEDNVYIKDINVGGKSKAEVEQIVKEISKNIDVEPKDASLNEENLEIIPEVLGKKVNIDSTLKAVLNAKEGERVEPVVEEVMPKITREDVEKRIVEIGSYSTPLIDDSENRVDNIDTASDYLDNEKVLPGEEFSFNGTLGRRTAEKGYKKAPIIKRTESGPTKGYGIGGGICQLSSTLYNAVEKAGLEITERHSHSKKVPYVRQGKDAMVSYGSSDFKFRNNRQNPVVIKTEISDEKVTVRLYEIRK